MEHDIYSTTDPQLLFSNWLQDAKNHPDIVEPTAMCLATIGDVYPSARIVLLKGHDALGFVFYTNLESRKSEDIKAHGKAALCFYWMPLYRQVRIVGDVEAVEPELADAYFASREREKQVGAWASIQSRPMHERGDLDERLQHFGALYKDAAVIPRPPHWSGWRVKPLEIEFWQQRDSRLHDRVVFKRQDLQASWQRQLLYP